MDKDLGQFFLVLQPDTEAIALRELQHWTMGLNIKAEVLHGGINFEAPYSVGFGLNYVLKIPTRILLRINSFKCKDFKRLETKLTHTTWGQYIGNGPIDFKISSHKSRVHIKKNILAVAEKAYLTYRKAQPASEKEDSSPQTFYIQIKEDYCTVSCDTSGEHLHKRGYKKLSSQAPVRETTASAILQDFLFQTKILAHDYHFIDPFCGSGTFIGEASLLYKNIKGLRPFSFETFKQLKKDKIVVKEDWTEASTFASFYGSDISKDAVSSCQKNLQSFENIIVEQKDVLKPNEYLSRPTVVICNPPYGLRVKATPLKPAIHQIDSHYSPDYMGLYISTRQSIPKLKNYKLIYELKLKNTSVNAQFYILKKIVE